MKITNETNEEISLQDHGQKPFAFFLIILGIAFCFIRSNTGASPLLIWSIGGALILLGLIVIFMSPFYSVDITKTTIHYIRKAWIGRNRYTDQMYNSADVTQIIVKSGIVQRRSNYQTFIVFKDGSNISIDSPNSGSAIIAWKRGGREIAMAQKIATLLNVPLQTQNSTSAGALLNIKLPW